MKNDGKIFEALVKHVQRSLGDSDVEIVSPEILRDSNGKTVGEIDIVLRRNVGSATVAVGIECRDRKKVGDRGWIQQLIGRRRDFKFNKIIAVSSSGFSPQAADLAREEDIDLIEVRDLSEIERKIVFKCINHHTPDGQSLPMILNSHSDLESDLGYAFAGFVDWKHEGRTLRVMMVIRPYADGTKRATISMLNEKNQPQPITGKIYIPTYRIE